MMTQNTQSYLSFVCNVGIVTYGWSPTFNHQKKTTTMAEPFAGPGGMAIGMVLLAAPPRQPLRDGLVEGAYEGICLIM